MRVVKDVIGEYFSKPVGLITSYIYFHVDLKLPDVRSSMFSFRRSSLTQLIRLYCQLDFRI